MAKTARFWLGLAMLGAGTTPAFAQDDGLYEAGILVVFLVLLLVYFIPTIVAFSRKHPNRWPILGINLLFGGTGLGWIGSLIWASGAVHKSPTGNNGGESGLNLFVNDPTIVRIENASAIEATDPLQKLERLKKLHEAGVLSDTEYEGMRRPLVQRLVP